MPLDTRQIITAIESGLKCETARLDDAQFNLEFYQADFSRFPIRTEDGTWDTNTRFKRPVPLMQRIVDILAEHLYKESPARTIEGDSEATEWLNGIYDAEFADALWQDADAKTTVGHFAAFQAKGSEDPDRPVELQLWGPEQIVPWSDPDDCKKVGAVATIEKYDEQRRLRLYTPEQIITFVSEKLARDQTSGGTAYRMQGQPADNPYRDEKGVGILPFTFVHYKFPTSDFLGTAPGTLLRQANDYYNSRLTELGDNLRFYGRPLALAEGMKPGWGLARPYKPGQFIDLPVQARDVAGNAVGSPPKLYYLESNLAIVGQEWLDLNNFLDVVLELNDVPPGTVRLQYQSDASGISLVVQTSPLLGRAIKRRKAWSRYEANLKTLVGQVGASHLRANRRDAAIADRVAKGRLSLGWPKLYMDLPGPERDRSDLYRVDNNYASPLDILMEREGLPRAAALERLKQIAADNAELAKLGLVRQPISPAVVNPTKEPQPTEE